MKKMMLSLSCLCISAMMLGGCNLNQDDSDDDNIEEQTPVEDVNDDNKVDVNEDTDDNINQDVENDGEDIVEDAEDVNDEDNKDE